MTLSGASADSTISAPIEQGTITDNDTPPSFAIGNPTAVAEGGTLSCTVTKTGAASARSRSTMRARGARRPPAPTLPRFRETFLAGDIAKAIIVATTDDAVNESAETVLMNLSSPTGGSTIMVKLLQNSSTG